jgi:hypothetical protein
MPRTIPTTPEHLRETRATLAKRVHEIDQELATLEGGDGPWIVLRDDGATYGGRWTRYTHDQSPKVYAYKGAAERRAARDGTAVWPLAVWVASRQTTDTQETR